MTGPARTSWWAWMLPLILGVLWPDRTGAFLPAPYGGVVIAPLPDHPLTLDPARASRQSELQLIRLIFDPLYRRSSRGRPRAHLVLEPPEVSPNRKIWRLRLRPGTRLHDQQPLTADLVVASLDRLRRGPNAYLLGPIQEVHTEDKETLVIKMARRADPRQLLSAPGTAIAVRQGNRWIGTGPFRLRSWRPGSVQLVANPQHFAGRPYIDQLSFTTFPRASGEVASFQVGKSQVSFRGTSLFGGQPRHPFAVVESPVRSAVFLRVGKGLPYLGDPQLRLAILQGIDRKRLARVAGSGKAVVSAGPVCRGLMSTPHRPESFDRRAAKKRLVQVASRHLRLKQQLAAGSFKLSLLVDASRFEDRDVARQIVADLDRIGVSIVIEERPAHEFQSRIAGNRFQLAIDRHPLQSSHVEMALGGILAAAGQRGAARRCTSAQRCGVKEARQLMRELPLIPLVHTSTRMAHDARLGGVKLLPGGRVAYEALFWARKSP